MLASRLFAGASYLLSSAIDASKGKALAVLPSFGFHLLGRVQLWTNQDAATETNLPPMLAAVPDLTEIPFPQARAALEICRSDGRIHWNVVMSLSHPRSG